MQLGNDNLVVRQHERYRCDLASKIGISPKDAEAVKLSPSVVDSSGMVKVSVHDCSRGGVGIHSAVFIPKRARMTVLITLGNGQPAVKLNVRVMRTTMLDRKPTYYLGTALEDENDRESLESLERLLNFAATLPQGTGEGQALPMNAPGGASGNAGGKAGPSGA
ncbi:MAG: PilZ domain-containing protein [Phycisphaerales bacterium]|nr:PilZ domain-containing protein [Phycisphaerales bacterium]